MLAVTAAVNFRKLAHGASILPLSERSLEYTDTRGRWALHFKQ